VRESANELHITTSIESYYGGSDQAPFEERSVPNVMFIYWPDEVYHTAADSATHVSRTNLLETAELSALLALKLSPKLPFL
jgi:GDP-D-mannose dehydratase